MSGPSGSSQQNPNNVVSPPSNNSASSSNPSPLSFSDIFAIFSTLATVISLYYIKSQIMWLYCVAIAIIGVCIYVIRKITKSFRNPTYIITLIISIGNFLWIGYLFGTQLSTNQFQPTIEALQATSTSQQMTMQPLQTAIALSVVEQPTIQILRTSAALAEMQQPTMQALQTAIARPVAISSTLVVSNFDSNNEDWSIGGYGEMLPYNSTGGHLGGYISAEDSGNGADWFWKAPQKFLGNKLAAYDGLLRFSLLQSKVTQYYTGTIDIVLASSDIVIIFDIVNPRSGWQTYIISLQENAGWIKPDGSAPTREDMQQVLSSLQRFEIRGEYDLRGKDIGGLDDVYLQRRSTN